MCHIIRVQGMIAALRLQSRCMVAIELIYRVDGRLRELSWMLVTILVVVWIGGLRAQRAMGVSLLEVVELSGQSC